MSWREYSQTRAIPDAPVSFNYHRRITEHSPKVLHILIGEELGENLDGSALDTPSEVALVHDDSISHGGRDEGQAVGDLGGGGVVVEEDARQGVAEDREQQCHMSGDC